MVLHLPQVKLFMKNIFVATKRMKSLGFIFLKERVARLHCVFANCGRLYFHRLICNVTLSLSHQAIGTCFFIPLNMDYFLGCWNGWWKSTAEMTLPVLGTALTCPVSRCRVVGRSQATKKRTCTGLVAPAELPTKASFQTSHVSSHHGCLICLCSRTPADMTTDRSQGKKSPSWDQLYLRTVRY